MFDSESAQLLRSAPEVPGLNPDEIPALLTRHYANLVSERLNGDVPIRTDADSDWPLERIADTYELVTSLHDHVAERRAAAFVAATAQQLIHRRQSPDEPNVLANVNRDRLDPTIAAALLFLVAEQYADANEAAFNITNRGRQQSSAAAALSENISDLAHGRPQNILIRAVSKNSDPEPLSLEERSLQKLLETLTVGLEMFAAGLLGRAVPAVARDLFISAEAAFKRVQSISQATRPFLGQDFVDGVHLAYPGPHHLASLLLAAAASMTDAALTQVPPPSDADNEAWRRWLAHRALSVPFVWPNHREAVSKGFHETGVSAIVVLPTGAGKTTLSSLKIAGVLSRGKKVIFIAPTHALVEQLSDDLQEMFPKEIMSSVVSSDYDLVLGENVHFQSIEVMTPERCLTMLSFAPDAFADVGLLVFDECHILSPTSGRIRRSIDSMLCLLGFLYVVPAADLLFLSAMVSNGKEFGEWISEQIGRPCIAVDLLWKPSRQARGVIVYKREEIEQSLNDAKAMQDAENSRLTKHVKSLRKAAERLLIVRPWTIWGLQHNWLSKKSTSYSTTPLLTNKVALAGSMKNGKIAITPNANSVASRIAGTAAKSGLKVIVFVNTKKDAIKIAYEISATMSIDLDMTEVEEERWNDLRWELGDLKHAILPRPMSAVPHNASMLRLERDLAERMFKRRNGASVIVATPTLAQGLNLPAHLAILAGDKRSRANRMGREDLEAHEILNAAARAGRAGHLANGMVLLIPEPVISFSEGSPLDSTLVRKLKSILPENDRCVTITDPLEKVLDRVMQGHQEDVDVQYLVNRLAALSEVESVEDPSHMFDIRRSLAGFMARKRMSEQSFKAKVDRIKYLVAVEAQGLSDAGMIALASRSGLRISILLKLRNQIVAEVGHLPINVVDWLRWCVLWLEGDVDSRDTLMQDIKRELLGACGRKKESEIIDGCLTQVLPGLVAWLEGKSISVIESNLGDSPESTVERERLCPRSRSLVGTVIPRAMTFLMGLISHIVENEGSLFPAGDVKKKRSLRAWVRQYGRGMIVLKSLSTPTIIALYSVECESITCGTPWDMPDSI